MEIVTSWHKAGIKEGLTQGISQGKETLVLLQLRRRFGTVSADLTAQLEREKR